MNSQLSTVLFDLDGTLLDTAPDLGFALNQVMQENGLSPLPIDRIRPFASSGSPGLLKLGFKIDTDDKDYERLRIQFLKAYHDHIYIDSKPFTGMDKVLAMLTAHKIQWGIVTNKPTALAGQILEASGLSEFCACLIGADDVTIKKPSAEGLLLACKRLQVTPEQCLYIGDAKRDIDAAKAAKIISVAALYGYIQTDDNVDDWDADFYVEQPEDILTCLKLVLTKVPA